VSKIKRLRPVLSGLVAAALAVATLPVLATTATASTDPLGGQPGPVTLSPTMGQDQWQPNPPAGTSVDDFMRHPVLSWSAITTLPVSVYRVQISPNAEFTNNTVTLPNGGLTTATQYDLPQTLPHASYYWRVRGEDAAGHATLWTGTQEGDAQSTWQFTKAWVDAPILVSPANLTASSTYTFSWQPLPDASAYQIQLSNNADFLQVVDVAWSDEGACTPSNCPSLWSASVGYSAGSEVQFGGDKWKANRATTGEQPKAADVTTFTCSTNNTSWTPYVLEQLVGGVSLTEAPVEGDCGDTKALAKTLQTGGPWYWHVRGLDGTSAAVVPAQTGIPCLTDGADCSAWSQTNLVGLATFTPSGTPTGVPAGLSANCPAVVPGSATPLCYTTPTLSWAAVPGANGYTVDVSVDPTFGAGYRSYLTAGPALTPRDSYLDNQAGRSYYWRVRACSVSFSDNAISCSTPPSGAVQSLFHKSSAPLPKGAAAASSTLGHDGLFVTVDNNETLAGAVRTVRTQQMTFHWDDLLRYEQQAGIAAAQEAKEYVLEYSTTSDWSDPATTTTITTDVTHWTKTDGTLADSGYYWRVAPVDGSGNLLAWSPTQTVVKGTIAPTVAIATQGPLTATSAVTLQFGAPVSGVTTATLGLRRVGGAVIPGHIVWPAPTPSMATFTPDKPLLPGDKVVPWVTSAVVDLAGNAAKAGTTVSVVDPAVDSASPTIKHTWSKISSAHASGGSYAKAAGVRDSISFSVKGSSLALRGVRTPDGGYGAVFVDGVKRKTVNFYAKTPSYGVTLWSALLSEGRHVVTVTVSGSHPAKSKGNAVNVDGLKVDGQMVQQTSAVQAWSRHRSTDAFKGSYDAESSYLSTWKGSKPSVSTAFAGPAVHIVGCKSPDSGRYAVYVDGKLKATMDGYQKFTSCNKTLVRIKGLSSGSHTVTVGLLGTRNKVSTGTKVSLDAIVAS
jgi:hypothetical protein